MFVPRFIGLAYRSWQLAENKYTKSIAVMPFATTTVQSTGAVQWISITHMDDEL